MQKKCKKMHCFNDTILAGQQRAKDMDDKSENFKLTLPTLGFHSSL